MAKTLALFFVLGMMVSCSTFNTERSISSVDKQEVDQDFYKYRHDVRH